MLSNQVYTDQTGREVVITAIPQRIISLVPSQTELLFDLGLGERVVGVTKFCIHPRAAIKSKVKIGGTKQLDIGIIKSLRPDLIIANKEENDRYQVEELMQYFPVWISDISSLTDALQMINNIGELTGKLFEARHIVQTIVNSF